MKRLPAAGLLVALAGCSTFTGQTILLRDASPLSDVIGILPPENGSNNMAAPDTMRRVAATVLVRHGYLPVASPAQEDQLRKAGMSDGGQLRALKPAALAAALHADGLLVTNVELFDDLNIGVYRSRVVAADWTLLDANGDAIWKASGKAANRRMSDLSGQGIAESFAEGMATKLVQKILKIHLLEEASHCAVLIGHAAPDWPVTGEEKLNRLRRDLKP